MTVTADELLLYAGALLILFLTPGPVWVALTARALSGGFRQAWPLAVGVTVGDILWPLLAILGVTWLVSVWGGFLETLKWVAAGIFLWMGWLLIRHAAAPIAADGRLTRPGMWAGFAAGVAVIVGNPKAILFYMGVLPGFFDLRVGHGLGHRGDLRAQHGDSACGQPRARRDDRPGAAASDLARGACPGEPGGGGAPDPRGAGDPLHLRAA
jgi:threonine/homoserine/homoserine lactone efflux protein